MLALRLVFERSTPTRRAVAGHRGEGHTNRQALGLSPDPENEGCKVKTLKWSEFYTERWEPGSYVLVLRALDDGSFEVYDPKLDKVIETFSNETEVDMFFVDEEYVLVEGRMDPVRPTQTRGSGARDVRE